MEKSQRVRDTLHGLIVFDQKDDADNLAWRLINTREFQRLRRIKQLGFSDLVYPGATHSRFSHSVGVFHTARKLIEIIDKKKGEKPDPGKALIVKTAALLHDVGHGPFSHTFEGAVKEVYKKQDPKKKPPHHEDWSVRIITGDTEIAEILRSIDKTLPEKVAAILKSDENKDAYSAVVSSQFDADRLDYIQRDRLMTGVQFGHVDQDWLFDCLETGKVFIGPDDPIEEECLCLSPKGIQVAEEYLEARYRLYKMVYMHKTTRAAERMLGRLLELVALNIEDVEPLGPSPVIEFFSSDNPNITNYLELDDALLWSELNYWRKSQNEQIATLASRILNRQLYKCFDLGELLPKADDNLFRSKITALKKALKDDGINEEQYLLDIGNITGYKWYESEGPSAHNKVMVKPSPGDSIPVDIASTSVVVEELLKKSKVYRLYFSDDSVLERVQQQWEKIK